MGRDSVHQVEMKLEERIQMANQPKKTLLDDNEEASEHPKNILASLSAAIGAATPEERDALVNELGLGRSIGAPEGRQPIAQTNADAAQMSRMSGGASHDADFIPAPPDWVTQHGGGMNTEEVEIKALVQGSVQRIKEHNPLAGEDAYAGNWAVAIYRDRWLRNLPPLPSTGSYDMEQRRQGVFDNDPFQKLAQGADQLAATAQME